MSNAYTSFLDAQRQLWSDATDAVETVGALPDANETMSEVDVGQTPHEVVYEENKLQLYHYESQTEEQHDVPILIVYALINRPYILDLQPDRSVVRTLLENGFDVYLVDWGEPSLMDHSLTLEDYVVRYIDNCVDEVRERSGQDAINVLGYCMGGTMSAMYTALFPEKVRNLGLMAAGLCFEGEGGLLEQWGDDEYFDPDAITSAYGNVPAEFLDTGFAMMDPVENYVTKYVRFYENVEDEDFVENFARMEQWLGDGIDVAGATFEQFIEDVYQGNELYRNELELGDRHVDVGEIDVPILQIVAEYDHLIPPSASKPFNDVVASEDTTTIEFRTGHIGMSVSSRSHDELWPEVCEWFEERSNGETEVAEMPVGEAGVEGAPEAEAGATDATVDEESSPEETAQAAAEQDEMDLGADQAGAAADDTDAEVELAGEEVSADEDAPPETDLDEPPTIAEPDDEGVPELETIDGIGPAYADRLRDAGVDSIADLAAADAAALAADTEVAPNRILSWIEQAETLLEETE